MITSQIFIVFQRPSTQNREYVKKLLLFWLRGSTSCFVSLNFHFQLNALTILSYRSLWVWRVDKRQQNFVFGGLSPSLCCRGGCLWRRLSFTAVKTDPSVYISKIDEKHSIETTIFQFHFWVDTNITFHLWSVRPQNRGLVVWLIGSSLV
jgi:hypothetical protein